MTVASIDRSHKQGLAMKDFGWQAGDPAGDMDRTWLLFLKSFRGNVSAGA
jgi:hypothetical protein